MKNQTYNVLVVDDDPTIVDFLSLVLTEMGCRAIPAWNVFGALEEVKKQRIDLVVTDLKMPGVHGLTLVEWLKGHEVHGSIPVIVITGHPEKHIIEKIRKTGVHSILFKLSQQGIVYSRHSSALAAFRSHLGATCLRE